MIPKEQHKQRVDAALLLYASCEYYSMVAGFDSEVYKAVRHAAKTVFDFHAFRKGPRDHYFGSEKDAPQDEQFRGDQEDLRKLIEKLQGFLEDPVG